MKSYLLVLLLLAVPAFAQQNVPDLPFDSVPDFFKLPPEMNFGEVSGVAVDSKGNIYAFTRSNTATGPAYGPAAAQLLEFGPKGEFIREIGKGLYAWSEAHTVRIADFPGGDESLALLHPRSPHSPRLKRPH